MAKRLNNGAKILGNKPVIIYALRQITLRHSAVAQQLEMSYAQVQLAVADVRHFLHSEAHGISFDPIGEPYELNISTKEADKPVSTTNRNYFLAQTARGIQASKDIRRADFINTARRLLDNEEWFVFARRWEGAPLALIAVEMSTEQDAVRNHLTEIRGKLLEDRLNKGGSTNSINYFDTALLPFTVPAARGPLQRTNPHKIAI